MIPSGLDVLVCSYALVVPAGARCSIPFVHSFRAFMVVAVLEVLLLRAVGELASCVK